MAGRTKSHLILATLIGALVTVSSPTSQPACAQSPDSTISDEATSGAVVIAQIEGAIGPATSDYLARVLEIAQNGRAECVVYLMDTPGGLSTSMRDIIKDIFASTIPIVVYVSPSGARAASAGALITLAAHVAVMAPGTNIGAAHPVPVGGGGEVNETMEAKIENDAAAYARSIAKERGRNVRWAEEVVRESISSTEGEAVDSGVVDFVADDVDALVEKLDGWTVTVSGEERTIRTAGRERVEVAPTLRERFLARISDPNIAYLLMLLGIFGIIFELQNPGAIFPGVIGVIAILTATFALALLPVNVVGIVLILVAMVLFLLEIKITSGGLLTVGGVVAMIIGSVMFIDSPLPFMKVSWTVIIPSVAFTALFFLFAVGLGLRAQGRKVATGTGGMLGERGQAKTAVHQTGSVFIHGEHWTAYSDAEIPAGTAVKVVEVVGMKLKVKPTDG